MGVGDQKGNESKRDDQQMTECYPVLAKGSVSSSLWMADFISKIPFLQNKNKIKFGLFSFFIKLEIINLGFNSKR